MRDDLGDRMKAQYENRTRYLLPRRTYTLVRVDGRNFHAYTQGLERPYDAPLTEDMDRTAQFLCENIAGCAFGFVQSDEISLLLTDFAEAGTEAWFDGGVQKICSITASMATAAFQQTRKERPGFSDRMACFDARVFTIPDAVEVANYFVWRQADCTRNSISMAAQTYCDHAKLQGKSVDEMQEILWQCGVNWNDYPARYKRGRVVRKQPVEMVRTFTHGTTGERQTVKVERIRWQVEAPPIFTQNRDYLEALIPRLDTRRT